jgi:23S rRNA (uracil1939-C5)-methyltransferase
MGENGGEPPLRVGTVVDGRVTDLAYGGAGVLRVSGWVIMTRGAFPDDHVRVRLRRKRKGLFEGELIEILEPSADRVPAPCPHLPLCGGCPLQGLAPAAQTRWKAAQALELLRRVGKFAPEQVAEPWHSPGAWFYRNKMEFTFGKRAWVPREVLERGEPFAPGPALGLHPRGRYDGVFDVEDCRLQSPVSNRIVACMRAIARRRGLSVYHSRADEGLLRHLVVRQAQTTRDLIAVIVVRHERPVTADVARELQDAIPEITGIVASINLRRATVAQGDFEVPLLGEPYWHETVCGMTFRIGASSFFQTQTHGAQALVDEILEISDFSGNEHVLDLYCGVGAFSLPVARRAKHLLGVEVIQQAVVEARANATRNGIRNAEFICSAVEAKEAAAWQDTAWDTVIVDPPRSGLHPRALGRLSTLRPRRIIYVSCNPSTLARDAGLLVAENGYRAKRLRVFDLFPQTPHLESVLLLERR